MKKVIDVKRFASGKPALTSSMSTGILKILLKYPSHPAINFEAMKLCWTNFQMQVAYAPKINMNESAHI